MGIFSGLTRNLGNIFQDPWAESNIGDISNRISGIYGQMEKSHQQSLQSALQSQLYNTKMFNRQVDLANSAHQREVADLRAAGLNPILSATGGSGAMVPSANPGAMAAAGSGSDNGVVNSATRQAVEMFKFMKAQKANIQSDTNTKTEVANTEKEKQGLIKAQKALVEAQMPEVETASQLAAANNMYEYAIKMAQLGDKAYFNRDYGVRKMNLLLPSVLKTAHVGSGMVNSAALFHHMTRNGMSREFSNGMSFTDNYF